jgi:AMP nucleosidase
VPNEIHPVASALAPERIGTVSFRDAAAAVGHLEEIYERNTRFLCDRFQEFANGETFTKRVRATYPFVRVTISAHALLDSRLSYGFVAGPGMHETTVTRPDLFRAYLIEQIRLLMENHGVQAEIGESSEPIPVHFAYRSDLFGSGKREIEQPLRDVFDTPDLAAMDDAIANGTLELPAGDQCSAPFGAFHALTIDNGGGRTGCLAS